MWFYTIRVSPFLPLTSYFISLSVDLKTDASGSIVASSPALLLKEKGVDFVTNADGYIDTQILFFVPLKAHQHALKIRNWSLEMFIQCPEYKLYTDVLEIKN